MKKKKKAGDCSLCGYVKGATIGFEPLTAEEKNILIQNGYELDLNIFDEEIARFKTRSDYSSARFQLHQLHKVKHKKPQKQS